MVACRVTRALCVTILVVALAPGLLAETMIPLIPESPRSLEAIVGRYGIPDDGFGTLLVYSTRVLGLPAQAALLVVDGALAEIRFRFDQPERRPSDIGGDVDQIRKALASRFGPPAARVRSGASRSSARWEVGAVGLIHEVDLRPMARRHTVTVIFPRE